MRNSDLNPDEMKNLIVRLMTEFAFVIDLHYEDEEIARLANEDTTFRVGGALDSAERYFAWTASLGIWR